MTAPVGMIGLGLMGSALSARLIEKCLFLRHHQSDAMLRFHHRPEFVDLLHDGAIAVSPEGFIVGTDIMGIKLLGAEHRRGELLALNGIAILINAPIKIRKRVHNGPIERV